MKGNAKVIAELNKALCAELTAINQYMVHSRMCANWGYAKIAQKSYDESIEEMRHADTLIKRILFLDAMPNMQKYEKIMIGTTVKEQMEYELEAETGAVTQYRKSIQISEDAGDRVSAALFEQLLADEEHHVDDLEAQLHLIESVGLQNYLAQQM